MSNITPPSNTTTPSIPSPLPVGPITNDELTASSPFITQRNHGRSHSPPRLHQLHTASANATTTTPASAALLAAATPSRYSPLSTQLASSLADAVDMEDDTNTTAAASHAVASSHQIQPLPAQDDAVMRIARKRMMTDSTVTPGGPDSDSPSATTPTTANATATGQHYAVNRSTATTTSTSPSSSSSSYSSSSSPSSSSSSSSTSSSAQQSKKAKTGLGAVGQGKTQPITSFYPKHTSRAVSESLHTPTQSVTASTATTAATLVSTSPAVIAPSPETAASPTSSTPAPSPPSPAPVASVQLTSGNESTPPPNSTPSQAGANPASDSGAKKRGRKPKKQSTSSPATATSDSSCNTAQSPSDLVNTATVTQLQRDRDAAIARANSLEAEAVHLRSIISQRNSQASSSVIQQPPAPQPGSHSATPPPSANAAPGGNSPTHSQAKPTAPNSSTSSSPSSSPTTTEESKPRHHRLLAAKDTHLVTDAKISQLGLPRASTTDLVLTIRPYHGHTVGLNKLLTQPIFPSHSKHPTQHRQIIAQILTDPSALDLAVPAIPSVILACRDPEHLDRAIASSVPGSPLHSYLIAARDYDSNHSVPLHLHPSLTVLRDQQSLVPSWALLLGPSTRSLGFNTETKQHTLVLNTPNSYTREIVCCYLRDRFALASHYASQPAIAFTDETAEERHWLNQARRRGLLAADLQLSDYRFRYQATQLRGFPTGPQFAVTSGVYVSQEELYGNNRQLQEFLAQAAPHCRAVIHTNAAGYTSKAVTFYHEALYRSELFNLLGKTSPRHGIVRPIQVTYWQCQKAASICCTYCWRPGHTAHRCPHNPAAEDPVHLMNDAGTESDTSPETHPSRACQSCYGFNHQEDRCPVPMQERLCRLCKEVGHCSSSCSRYSATWTPLTPPQADSSSPRAPSASQASPPRRPNPILTQHSQWAGLHHPPLNTLPHDRLPPPFCHPAVAFPPLPILPRPSEPGPIGGTAAPTLPPSPSPSAATTLSPTTSPSSPTSGLHHNSPPSPPATDPHVTNQLTTLSAAVTKLSATVAALVEDNRQMMHDHHQMVQDNRQMMQLVFALLSQQRGPQPMDTNMLPGANQLRHHPAPAQPAVNITSSPSLTNVNSVGVFYNNNSISSTLIGNPPAGVSSGSSPAPSSSTSSSSSPTPPSPPVASQRHSGGQSHDNTFSASQ
jgi:hypothetical protein